VDASVLNEEFVKVSNIAAPYPSAFIVFPSKSRIAPYVGPFNADAMAAFLDRIPRGSVRTSAYTTLPELIAGASSASGTRKEEL
jgi:hypothetical protein